MCPIPLHARHWCMYGLSEPDHHIKHNHSQHFHSLEWQIDPPWQNDACMLSIIRDLAIIFHSQGIIIWSADEMQRNKFQMKYERDKKYCIKCHPPNVNISVEFQPWWKSPLLLFNDWFDHSKVYYIPVPWAFCRQYWNVHLKANSWKKCLYFDSNFTEVYPWGSNWKQIRIGSGTGSALSRWLATILILAKLAHTGIARPQIQYVFIKISIFTTQSTHAIFIITLHCRFSKHFCCPGSRVCVLSVW